ncbi:uncharacterized protein TRAVEDRAFT_79507, partial [Trametes versicolor FP-101664 SS1]|uniref:uncharacterized protein n=1 Tax=Trametes versicolor (strain FP-101664) TaxID=717944 RepID=UPI0004622096
MSSAYSWDVYAESLTYLGYGYPLWCPDTWNNGKPWDLNVGDVGWLRNGQFCPLLRTTATDAAQQPFRTLPEGHSPLVMARGALSEYPERFSRPTIFHSNTINTSMVMGEVSVSPADFGIGGSFSFKSVEGKGALLMLSPRAEETIFQSATTVVNYMRANHKKWEDFANDPHGLGLNLEPEDIIFVTGMIKTVDWGITTFTSMQREVEASISCTLGGVGSASISAHVTNRSATNLYPKAGPSSSWGPSAASSQSPPKADQCIFLHYYKLKRRAILGMPPRFE